MRKLIVLSFISLDGVMQAPGGPDEDPTGNFSYGGWSVGYFDDFLGKVMDKQMGHGFDLLLGRKTYDIFAAYWPYISPDVEPIAGAINNSTKYVASRALKKLDWSNSVLIEGDVVRGVEKLKQQDGPEIQVHGSGNLIQTLLRHDLVDELWLKIFPLTLGRGKRLFAVGTVPAAFRLIKCEVSPSGVLIAGYERAGDIVPGSFALDVPTEAELARRKKLQREG